MKSSVFDFGEFLHFNIIVRRLFNILAMRQIRRIDLIWRGEELGQYEKLKSGAAKSGMEIPQFVKDVLAKAADMTLAKKTLPWVLLAAAAFAAIAGCGGNLLSGHGFGKPDYNFSLPA